MSAEFEVNRNRNAPITTPGVNGAASAATGFTGDEPNSQQDTVITDPNSPDYKHPDDGRDLNAEATEQARKEREENVPVPTAADHGDEQQQEEKVVNVQADAASTIYDEEDKSQHPNEPDTENMHKMLKEFMKIKGFISEELANVETWTLAHLNAFKSMMAQKYGDVVGNVPMTQAQVDPRMQIDEDWPGDTNIEPLEDADGNKHLASHFQGVPPAGVAYSMDKPSHAAGAPGTQALSGGVPGGHELDPAAVSVKKVQGLNGTVGELPNRRDVNAAGQRIQSPLTDPSNSAQSDGPTNLMYGNVADRDPATLLGAAGMTGTTGSAPLGVGSSTNASATTDSPSNTGTSEVTTGAGVNVGHTTASEETRTTQNVSLANPMGTQTMFDGTTSEEPASIPHPTEEAQKELESHADDKAKPFDDTDVLKEEGLPTYIDTKDPATESANLDDVANAKSSETANQGTTFPHNANE